MRWLLLILSLILGEAQSQHPTPGPSIDSQVSKKNPAQTQTKAASYPRGTEKNPLVVKRLDAEETPERRAQQSDERDEKATNERRLVFWTWMLALWTGLLAIIAGIQVWMFWRQLGYMEAAVRDSTKAAEASKKNADASLASLRPWLSCKIEIGEPLTFNKDGDAVFALHFIVENVGHSPAMSVQIQPSIVLLQDRTRSLLRLKGLAKLIQDLPVKTAAVIFGGGHSGSLGTDAHGLIVFQNRTHKFYYKIPIKRVDIEKACEDIKPSTAFFPEIQGLLSYTYPSATVRAVTGFSRTIFKIGGAFELDKPVNLDEMRLEEDSPMGDFAT